MFSLVLITAEHRANTSTELCVITQDLEPWECTVGISQLIILRTGRIVRVCLASHFPTLKFMSFYHPTTPFRNILLHIFALRPCLRHPDQLAVLPEHISLPFVPLSSLCCVSEAARVSAQTLQYSAGDSLLKGKLIYFHAPFFFFQPTIFFHVRTFLLFPQQICFFKSLL